MPRQLIYTSSPRLLDSGKTGFGTVARSRGIGTTLARLLERVSQLPRHCPQEDVGAVYTYRIIETEGAVSHVLSRIVRAGFDYSGRANHLAHHLICTKEEVDVLTRHPAAPTPAGLILALSAADFWKNQWKGDPAYLPDEFAFSARYLPNPAEQATWRDLTGHKRNALLPNAAPYAEGCFIVVPDACDPATELMLNHETDWLSPDRGWGRTFTTHLCSTDMADSFSRIYVHESSANIQRMRRSRRPILRVHEELVPEPERQPAPSPAEDDALPIPDPPSTPILPDKAAPSAQTIALKPLKYGRSYRYSDSEETMALARSSRWKTRRATALAAVLLLAVGGAYAYHVLEGTTASGRGKTTAPPLASAPPITPASDDAPTPPPAPSEPEPERAPLTPEVAPAPPVPAPVPPPAAIPSSEPASPEILPPLKSRRDMPVAEGDALPADLAWLLSEGRENLAAADIAWIDLADGAQGQCLRSHPGHAVRVVEENGKYLFERVKGSETASILALRVDDHTLARVETPEGRPAACSLTAENAEGIPVRFLLAPAPRVRVFPITDEQPASEQGEWPQPDLASRGNDWYPALDRETRTYRFTPEQIYDPGASHPDRLAYATDPSSPPALPLFPDMNRQGEEQTVPNVVVLPDGWRRREDAAPQGGSPARFPLAIQTSVPAETQDPRESVVESIVNRNLAAHGGPEVSLAYIYRLVWSIREKRDEQALSKYLNLFAKPKTREYLRDLLGETPRQHRGDRNARIAPPLTLTARDAGNRIARRRIAAELRKPESTARILAALRADMQRRLIEAGRSLPPPRPPVRHLDLILDQLNWENGKLVWIFKRSSPSDEQGARPERAISPQMPESAGEQ